MNDKIKDVSFIFPKGSLEDDWREEALRHREEILQLKVQLQQKENIIKEVREYANTDKNCVPKHIKDYINNLLDKEVN